MSSNCGDAETSDSAACLVPADGVYKLNISVNSVETGDAVLSCIVSSHLGKGKSAPKLEDIMYPLTYTLPRDTANMILIGIFATLSFAVALRIVIGRSMASSQLQKRKQS
jgi:hypothetical protein